MHIDQSSSLNTVAAFHLFEKLRDLSLSNSYSHAVISACINSRDFDEEQNKEKAKMRQFEAAAPNLRNLRRLTLCDFSSLDANVLLSVPKVKLEYLSLEEVNLQRQADFPVLVFPALLHLRTRSFPGSILGCELDAPLLKTLDAVYYVSSRKRLTF